MVAVQKRSIVIDPEGKLDHCMTCGVRTESVCSTIENDDLMRLAKIAQPVELPVGKAFIDQGSSANAFFNITEGSARLVRVMPDGRRQITGFARKGSFLGLGSITTYNFSAEALEPLNACRFSKTDIDGIIDDFPAFEHRILENAVTELAAAQDQILLLGRKTARERVATFILSQAELLSNCRGVSPQVSLPMTRADIADYLGLTIETVSRTLTKLKNDRLISLPSTSAVNLLDVPRLTSIAEGLDSE